MQTSSCLLYHSKWCCISSNYSSQPSVNLTDSFLYNLYLIPMASLCLIFFPQTFLLLRRWPVILVHFKPLPFLSSNSPKGSLTVSTCSPLQSIFFLIISQIWTLVCWKQSIAIGIKTKFLKLVYEELHEVDLEHISPYSLPQLPAF